MSGKKLYRVVFVNHQEVFELYARNVSSAEVYGFVEIGGWVFGEKSRLLVDPAEERLKALFGNVERSLIPMTSIIRIDEVEQQGEAKVTTLKGPAKVTPLPRPES